MDKNHTETKYWWLNVDPKIWKFSDRNIGEAESFTLYNENGNKRGGFQNFLDARVGDIVIGYESSPVMKVVALAEITQESDGEKILVSKTEQLENPIAYKALKECPELQNFKAFNTRYGTLFKVEEEEYNFIIDIIREENPLKPKEDLFRYTKKDFLADVFMPEQEYDDMESLVREKKNVIFQGAPGVGKTYAAEKLAFSMMGKKDNSRIVKIQFHQNYSYEDFIMGYRPEGNEFKLKYGIFYQFCQKAENDPNNEYFFIIDEINRGNLSKIFGELLMLIEKEYRGSKITLAYNGMPFSVPENLYIIGMMNTADRSLAMIDYALRRRFSFYEMKPAFFYESFLEYQRTLENEIFDTLIEQIKRLNMEIAKDDSLGRGFQIGHSYFCGKNKENCTDQWMRLVVEFDIIPTLEEYWFDEPNKLEYWKKNLRGVLNDER